MIRISARSGLPVIGAVLLAACIVAGCNSGDGGGKSIGMPAVTPPQNQAEVRDFTMTELDTLRALKARNHVTRDEYWDDRGGVLANDVVEVWYPPGKLTVSHGMYVLDNAMLCRGQLVALFGAAPEQKLTIVCAQTMEAYTEFTGRLWWNYAHITDDRIIFQPIPILAARGLLNVALPRELYEWSFEQIGGDNTPRWLIEGLASWLTDERRILEDNLGEFPDEPARMTLADMEEALDADNDKMRARIGYYNAYKMVKRLGDEFGREAIATMIKAIGDGSDVEAAAQSAFQRSYQDVVAFASDWETATPEPKESQ